MVITLADAIADPWAVVVMDFNTGFAVVAVERTRWAQDVAGSTYFQLFFFTVDNGKVLIVTEFLFFFLFGSLRLSLRLSLFKVFQLYPKLLWCHW